MHCEIIAVGSELLLGQIVDTNSAWIGEQLALAGIDSHYQTRVGDNLQRIVDTLRIALDRADAVIVCGGLGPTQDDITREAIASVMGSELRQQTDLIERISERFARRGRQMPANNLRQAEVPEGARVLAEMPGTAPGLLCPVGDGVIYAVPGVPSEMRRMVRGSVIADLRRRAGATAVIRSRTLRTWGLAESRVAEMLSARIEALQHDGNPTIAFLASGIEGIKVRITAKAADEAHAEQILASEEARVRAVIGGNVFGVDQQTMESVVLDLLRQHRMTLALAESLTGGLVGARITAIPGASEVFRGALVSYASDLKFELLGVPRGPVVSEQAAASMALGVRRLLSADVGLSATGVAGPTEQDGQAVGTVYISAALGETVQTRRLQLGGDREQIRQLTAISLLDLLRRQLLRNLQA